MKRNVIDLDQVHASAQNEYTGFHSDIVKQVADAIAKEKVVVVGMKTNVPVKQARKALADAGIEYTYLEFGGYTSQWRQRLAIKMYTGWPTFPQVFINGRLVGGASNVKKLIQEGKLQQILQEGR